jgi:thiol-disulfide isomerase/thioredoxin
MLRLLILMALSGLALPALANSEPPKDHDAKPDPHASGGEKTEEGAKPASIGPKRDYNPGKVIPFPDFAADKIDGKGGFEHKTTKGRATMVIFIASWCEPCQILMNELKQLARKYSSASTEVIFVFSHDTKEDAAGFLREYQISNQAVLANPEILTKFKNPELPSVYIGDRWGYMGDRFIKFKKSDIDKIDQSMSRITAL